MSKFSLLFNCSILSRNTWPSVGSPYLTVKQNDAFYGNKRASYEVVTVAQSDFNSQMHSVLQYPCFDILLFFVENILLKPIQYLTLKAQTGALILDLLLTKTLSVTSESEIWQCVHIKQTAKRQTLKMVFTYPVKLRMNKSFQSCLSVFCTFLLHIISLWV